MARSGPVWVLFRKKWRWRRPDIATAAALLVQNLTADGPDQRRVACLAQFPAGEDPLHVAGT
ncbi:MAG: hypothetical protein QY307_05625 [Acidimicrobiia bacterium]|nr:MAG: hypothetical protein QY307_05625 [Acidimicrobiia bacterium]